MSGDTAGEPDPTFSAAALRPWSLRFGEPEQEAAFQAERIGAYRGTFLAFMVLIALMAAALIPLDLYHLNGPHLGLALAVRALFVIGLVLAAAAAWRRPAALAWIAPGAGMLATACTLALTLLHGSGNGGPVGNATQFAFIGLVFLVLLPNTWRSRLLLAALLVGATFWVAEATQGSAPRSRVLMAELFVTGVTLMLLFLSQREDRLRREQFAAMARLRTLAVSDPLTGAANRRAFFTEAEKELERAGREASPLSLLVFDIDHFKDINDRHGHAVGDRVLQHLVAGVGEVLRPFDRLARLGGEEFVILLPGTGRVEAAPVAERVRAAVAALRVPAESGALGLTVSIGVSSWRPGEGIDATLGRADDRLYRAKDEGRNRVGCPGEIAAAEADGLAGAESLPS